MFLRFDAVIFGEQLLEMMTQAGNGLRRAKSARAVYSTHDLDTVDGLLPATGDRLWPSQTPPLNHQTSSNCRLLLQAVGGLIEIITRVIIRRVSTVVVAPITSGLACGQASITAQ